MKKIIVVLAAILLVGCSGNNDEQILELQNKIMELEEALEQKAESNATGSSTEASNENVNLIDGGSGLSKSNEKLPIELGEAVVVEDYCEFSVTNVTLSKTIEPPNPTGYYTYYEAKNDGESYLDITLSIKSLLSSAKSADEFAKVTFLYEDKYEYNTFSVLERDGGSDFTYSSIYNIEPLKSGNLHYLSTVPNEIGNDDTSLSAIINIGGNEYILFIH